MSRFSIIIPVYKNAIFVTWVVKSLLDQEFHDWEAIIIDDSSDDPAVIAAMQDVATADSRIQLLFQTFNQGQSAARNLGLSKARGDYVIFLDFDDLLFPWSLHTLNRVIETEGFPVFIVGSAVPLSENQRDFKGVPGLLRTRSFKDYYEYRVSEVNWWFVPSGAAIKTSSLKEVGGFWETRVYCEDIDLWNRLGCELSFVRIDSPPIYGYRLHSASAHHDWTKMHAGLMRVISTEMMGGYPGGSPRREDRIRIIASHARHHALDFASTHPQIALQLYRVTFCWNLELKRWKFLFLSPMVIIFSFLGLSFGNRQKF